MTMSNNNEPVERPAMTGGKRAALSGVAGVLGIFSAGIMTGALLRIAENGTSPARIAVVLIAACVALACIFGVVRIRRMAAQEPMAKSVRKANRLTWISTAYGAVLGAAMIAGGEIVGSEFSLASNDPIAPSLAIFGIVAWCIALPPLTIAWLRAADEHERKAYNEAGLAAFYLYVFAVPGWWLAARGGFVPQPDAMQIFTVMVIVWGLGWMWRRSR